MALRIATRSSPLARAQAELVAARLRAVRDGLEIETVIVDTDGDRRSELPIEALGGQGVFSVEVDRAVAEGRADVAVHSAKDLPSALGPDASSTEGVSLVACPEREDVRDALIGSTLSELSPGASVATGSLRRRVQLVSVRSDLMFVDLRGNIGTRLERVPPGGAAVIALAALERLGLSGRADEVLATTVMLPQVGQGALALCAREGDNLTAELLQAVDDAAVHAAVRAERAFLHRLGGGCEAPVAAHGVSDESGGLVLEAMLASRDGHVVIRRRVKGSEPLELGSQLAETMLVEDGGAALTGQS